MTLSLRNGIHHPASVGCKEARDDDDDDIDLNKPILGQLHRLRRTRSVESSTTSSGCHVGVMSYHEWIHRPTSRRIQPEFFENAVAEQLTKVTWWVVPLIWLPVALLCLFVSLHSRGMQHSLVESGLFVALGILLWQLIEYGLHRFVFHWNPQTLAGVYVHFLFHGCHHKFPQDVERLVFPPFPAALIAACIFGVLKMICPTGPQALLLFSGVVFGYVLYDCCHYWIHAGWMKKNRLSKNHMRHHYLDDGKNFGISSPLFDYILGSM